MSIYAYVGLPGSGKSYAVVANVILVALKAGRRVVSNVPCNVGNMRAAGAKGEFVEFPTERIATSPELIEDYCTPGSVVVLDEVWRLFPAGQKSHQVPEPYRKLLAEHRHMVDADGNSMSIYLVTQDLAQISEFARVLVETTMFHEKLSHVGLSSRYRVDVCKRAVKGKPTQGSILRSVHGRYDKKIFPMYLSHTQSEADGAGANEKVIDGRANVWLRPSIWIGGLGVIAACWFGFSTLSRLLKGDAPILQAASVATGLENSERLRAVEPTAVAKLVPLPAFAPMVAGPSRTVPNYRLVGFVRMDDSRGGYGLISDGHSTVQVPWSECYQPGDGRTICNLEGFEVSELGARARE